MTLLIYRSEACKDMEKYKELSLFHIKPFLRELFVLAMFKCRVMDLQKPLWMKVFMFCYQKCLTQKEKETLTFADHFS